MWHLFAYGVKRFFLLCSPTCKLSPCPCEGGCWQGLIFIIWYSLIRDTRRQWVLRTFVPQPSFIQKDPRAVPQDPLTSFLTVDCINISLTSSEFPHLCKYLHIFKKWTLLFFNLLRSWESEVTFPIHVLFSFAVRMLRPFLSHDIFSFPVCFSVRHFLPRERHSCEADPQLCRTPQWARTDNWG